MGEMRFPERLCTDPIFHRNHASKELESNAPIHAIGWFQLLLVAAFLTISFPNAAFGSGLSCAGFCVYNDADGSTVEQRRSCAAGLVNENGDFFESLTGVSNPTHTCHTEWTQLLAANSPLIPVSYAIGSGKPDIDGGGCFTESPTYPNKKCAGWVVFADPPQCPDGLVKVASNPLRCEPPPPPVPCPDACSCGPPPLPEPPLPPTPPPEDDLDDENPAVGNPIMVRSGVKVISETDYAGQGDFPLVWKRSYVNHDPAVWRFSYSDHIEFHSPVQIRVVDSSGRIVAFYEANGTWVGASNEVAKISYDATAQSWTFVAANGVVQTYNDAGQLTSITNQRGFVHTLQYTGGTLTSVTNHAGRSLTLTHDGNGRVSQVTVPGGYSYRYEYDSNGMLEYVRFPDETPLDLSDDPTVTYHYEEPTHTDLVTGITDELGNRYATYAYNSDRKAISTELAGGVDKYTVTFTGSSDETVTVTNPLGRTSVFNLEYVNGRQLPHQVDGQPTQMCNATVKSLSYNADGYLDSRTDENGVVTDFVYNSRGLEISRTVGVGTPEARTTTATWHPTLNKRTQIVRTGQTSDMTYDADGRLLTQTITDTQTQTAPYITTGNTRTTTYSYSVDGLLLSMDGPRTDLSDTITFTYDANGNVHTTTNALGHVTEIFSRDARGLPTEVKDPNGLVTLLSYDARGRLTSIKVKSSQGDVLTGFTYDAAGQLIRTDLPTGGFVEYEYDAAQRLVAIENDLSERIEYVLDAAGNITNLTFKGPGQTILQTQSQVFDELSRLRELVDGENNTASFDYDNTTNLTGSTDALSRSSSQAYDTLDQAISSTDAASGITAMTYDERGNLTSVTDPKGVLTTYVYDGLDNLIQEVSADSGTTTYHYDAAGNLAQMIDGRGVVVNYAYDALNRLLSVTYPAATSENISYSYDLGSNGKGRLSSIVDESGSTTYAYDDRGNITQDSRIVDGTAYVTGYSYDLADRLISQTYPSGRVVNITRDSQGRAESVAHTHNSISEALVQAVEYDGRSRLAAISYGNSLYQTRGYDNAGRLTNITLTDSHSAAPVAYNDAAQTDLGVSVTIDVLSNDKDVNLDQLSIHTITQPAQGSVAINGDQTLSFTPTGSSDYVAEFTYQASDGVSPSNVATVRVAVTDPGFVDSDGDGLADDLETLLGLNPLDASDAVADVDGDGVDNYAEYLAGTDPLVNDAGLSAAITAASPYAYWKMDETSGSTAADASGNGLDGTYYYTNNHAKGAASVLEAGTAVDFTGGHIQRSHSSGLNMSGDYTVEGLVRVTSNDYSYLHTKYAYIGGTLRGQFIAMYYGKIYVVESGNSVFSNTQINDGNWHHIAVVRRGNDIEIWINGELDSVATVTVLSAASVTSALEIMGWGSGARDTHGTIDDWALYTKALTPAELKAHFKSLGDKDLDGIPSDVELLTQHDPLDASDATKDYDGDGATAYDEYVAQTDPMVNLQGYSASVLADNPEAFWPLDDATSTADDLSGNGHDGTYLDTYTQQQTPATTSGESVAFAGGRIEIPGNASLQPAGDYTVEGYFKWTGTGVGMLIGSWNSTYPFEGVSAFTNHTGSSLSVGQMMFRDQGLSGYSVASASTNLNDGSWRHYAFVRRGSALELYIDGVLEATQQMSSILAHASTNGPNLMGWPNGVNTVDGSADEVAMYNHALSHEDILQHVIQGQVAPPVVSVAKDKLPSNLDRWLEAGTMLALYDTQTEQMEAYRLSSDGEWLAVKQTAALSDSTTIRAVRDDTSVTVYLHDAGQWSKHTLSNRHGFQTVASAGYSESWSLTYDAVSNITDIAKPGGTENFGYDSLDRLNAYTLPGEAQVTYAYDAVGNRLSETQAGVTQTHSYGVNDNRLMQQSGLALTYDAVGNRLSDEGGTRTYTYNKANRLVQVALSGSSVGTYTYNALGQRVRKVAGSDDIDYVYDLGGRLIGEYDSGTLIKEYVYFNGTPLAQIDASTTYLHTDQLGTPRIGTHANGTVVWRWDSDPFGSATPNEDPDGDLNSVTVNLRFPGQYADVENSMYYNYFRTYDPGIGRYTQADPVGLIGGINRFAYGNLNPTRFIDRDGLTAIAVEKAVRGYAALIETSIVVGTALGSRLALMSLNPSERNSLEDALYGPRALSCPIDLDSTEGCREEIEQCKSLCRRVQADPDGRGVWGGSWAQCLTGCVSNRCLGEIDDQLDAEY